MAVSFVYLVSQAVYGISAAGAITLCVLHAPCPRIGWGLPQAE
ncbi:hypothetical protein [Phaeobacter italicus]|nr:hypothetical protein [Phaeobacter italicus]